MDATDQYSASSSLLEAHHQESENHIQESGTRESQDHESDHIFVIGDGEDLSDPWSPEPEPENQDNDYCWTTKSWKHEDSYTLRQLHETDGKQPEQRVLARQNEAAKAIDPLQLPELPESGVENSIDGFSEADLEPEEYDEYTCTPESWLRRNTGDLEHVYGMGHTKRERVKEDLQVLYVLHKHLRINLDLIEKYGTAILCSRQELTKKNYKALTDLDAAQSLFAQGHIGLTETLRSWEEELRPCTGVSLKALHDHFRNSRNYFAHYIGRPYPFKLSRFHVEALKENYELIFEKIGKNIIILEDHLEDECVWSKPAPDVGWSASSSIRAAAGIGADATGSWGIRSEHMESVPNTPREDAEGDMETVSLTSHKNAEGDVETAPHTPLEDAEGDMETVPPNPFEDAEGDMEMVPPNPFEDAEGDMETVPPTPRKDAKREETPPGCLSGIIASCLPLKWRKGRLNHGVEGGNGKERYSVRFFAQCRQIDVFRAGLDWLEGRLFDARNLYGARLMASATQPPNWENEPPVTPHQGESIALN
ncbi:hypothetical protein IQ07DRAFT_641855 [Pyrenochaeta sp. DS3sAY3a]|nr:hypothetical protein IQ07DRAFT_641855 [Pyrenochaeta sp. DS3sAY3a]